ncbi:hypothetical protein MK079_01685 [Candidatus Gracilibacteria bacterium]|nr:hypothetical protein [Candidatus Gracilibacteria bacterium]
MVEKVNDLIEDNPKIHIRRVPAIEKTRDKMSNKINSIVCGQVYNLAKFKGSVDRVLSNVA